MGYDGKSKISGSVSHADIQACLGVSFRTNRELCTAAAINGNSFYKPLNSPLNFGNGAYGGLSDAERRKYNWGWKTLTGATFAYSLYDALVAKWDGGTWEKDLPYGGIGTSPYRLQDFNGYDNNADTPFKVELTSNTITQGQVLRFSLLNISEMYNFPSWEFFGGIALNKIGLGVYIGSSKPSANGFWVYMIAGYNFIHTFREVLDDSEKLLNIPATYLNERGITSGTYYMIPFITIDTSGMTTSSGYTIGSVYCTNSSGYMSMTLPTSKLQFSITAATKPADNVDVILDSVTLTHDRTTMYISVSSLMLQVKNTGSSSSAYSITVSVAPNASSIRGSILSGSFADKKVSLSGGGSTTVETVSKTVVWETYIEAAQVDVTLTVTVDGSTSTSKRTIQILSNKE